MRPENRISRMLIVPLLILLFTSCHRGTGPGGETGIDTFTEDLKLRTFRFFWEQADSSTFQIPDRYPTRTFTSIAATGFGLASYLVGIENGYITRQEGSERVLGTLEWLWNAPQGENASGTSGYRGFFYHFLQYGSGTRYRQVELSTIDTGLLMAGILACQSYFNGNNPTEQAIRKLADSLFLRVEWDWAMNGQNHMSMGWHPESGFIEARWTGYNEAMILLVMALGSPTHTVNDSVWAHWCEGYEWKEFYGRDHVNFSPLFGHQYSHMFIDFRGIRDPYMHLKGIDYFENARRATLSNRDYCIDNPNNFKGYGENTWGLTACDGPAHQILVTENRDTVQFWDYRARGASALGIIDDGTIAPTAAGGSIPYAPDLCLNALYHMKQQFGEQIYGEYGFRDAFNLTFPVQEGNSPGWFDVDYLGIDQGPILIQLENHHTGLIWDIMKKNRHIVNGLKKAGFSGGWLDNEDNIL